MIHKSRPHMGIPFLDMIPFSRWIRRWWIHLSPTEGTALWRLLCYILTLFERHIFGPKCVLQPELFLRPYVNNEKYHVSLWSNMLLNVVAARAKKYSHCTIDSEFVMHFSSSELFQCQREQMTDKLSRNKLIRLIILYFKERKISPLVERRSLLQWINIASLHESSLEFRQNSRILKMLWHFYLFALLFRNPFWIWIVANFSIESPCVCQDIFFSFPRWLILLLCFHAFFAC